MTSAFKEYINIQNSLKRLSYKSFLDIRKDFVEYQLEFSLMLDGRFYGAEMIDGDYSIKDLKGILAPYITEYEDPVEAVKRVRENDY